VTTYPRFAVLVLALLALASSACQLPVFFPEVLVNTSDPDYQVCDDVALGEDGEFVVVWTEFPIESEILGRRYDRLTTPLDGPFPVNADTTIDQAEASVAQDAEGAPIRPGLDRALAEGIGPQVVDTRGPFELRC